MNHTSLEHFAPNVGVLFLHVTGISCGVPPPLENGFYSAEDFHAGSTVTYQCNNGYYLLGDSRMFCTDNGSWNGISPSCLGEINLGSTVWVYSSSLGDNHPKFLRLSCDILLLTSSHPSKLWASHCDKAAVSRCAKNI